jgi:hypothetical protein
MSKASSRIKRRKNAKEKLNMICEQPANHLIIHYSCESFYDIPQGRTPRITSIAVRYVDSAQTKSFSIHKVAELNRIPFDKIADYYDDLERKMLDEYFVFIEKHKRFSWIHLNMRDINYGFEAINHRYLALGGYPIEIDDSAKIDVGRLLVDLYGKHYIAHPRFENLCRRNTITMNLFLTGKEEASAFTNKEYVKLHQSTLRKVDNIHTMVIRAYENDLKTNSNLLKQYGISPQSIYQLIQEHWLFALVVFVLGLFISILTGKFFN